MTIVHESSIRQRAESTGKEIRNRWFTTEQPPDVLYHYTDATGLLGILATKELWATNIYYLNDSSELHYGLDLIKRCFERRLGRNQNPVHVKLLTEAKTILLIFKAVSEAFVVCFCAKDNLLSQWQTYASKGDGYSIGIKSVFFTREIDNPLASQPQVRLRQIEYKHNRQEQITYEFIDSFCSLAILLTDGTDERQASRVVNILGNVLGGELRECLSCFKHEAFEAEAEWRLIYTVSNYDSPEGLRFRSGTGSIVPYMPLPFVPNIAESGSGYPITSVRIGPTAEPKVAMMALLSLLGSHFGRNHSIMPVNSEIPLRSTKRSHDVYQ
jgi:hypothetical protein